MLQRLTLFLLVVSIPLAPYAKGQNQSQEPPYREFQAGFDDVPQFGGLSGVSGQLLEGDEKRPGFISSQGLDPWFEWKGRLHDEHGVALGFFSSTMYQQANESLNGLDDNGLGSVLRFFGSWTLLNGNAKNPGSLEWRLENRTNLRGLQSPLQLGEAVGARALNTGFGYPDDFSTDVSILAWTQHFADSTAGITAGRLAFDAYLDSMAFQSNTVGFLNRSFIVNPTIGTTGIGALGIVSKGFLTEHIFIGAHIYDGNAVSGEFDWDTVQEDEYLKAIEIGWAGSVETSREQKIAFTYWEKDESKESATPSGHGWAISWNWLFEDWFPFIRLGHSDGGAGVTAETALSGGFQYSITETQEWSLGAGWAEPANAKSDRDEYVIETSYSFQLARNISVLTDVQLLIDPANDPSNDRVWIGTLRLIVTL